MRTQTNLIMGDSKVPRVGIGRTASLRREPMKRITISLPEDTARLAKILSAHEGLTLSRLVNQLLLSAIKRGPKWLQDMKK